MKIFRSSHQQMSLRLKGEEQQLTAKPEIKQISPLHEGALVSLPVEKIMERKSQKGSIKFGFISMKRKINVQVCIKYL